VRWGIRFALLSAALALVFPVGAAAFDGGVAVACQGGAAAGVCLDAEAEPTYTPVYTPAEQAPNGLRFARLMRKRNGYAVLYARVSAPGRLVLRGRGVRRLKRVAPRAAIVPLPVKPKVRLRHFLKKHGKGRIRVEVTFTPVGGLPRTLEKPIVLKRRKR